jgi:hypothetical protein
MMRSPFLARYTACGKGEGGGGVAAWASCEGGVANRGHRERWGERRTCETLVVTVSPIPFGFAVGSTWYSTHPLMSRCSESSGRGLGKEEEQRVCPR